MAYRVKLMKRTEADLAAIWGYINVAESDGALRWFAKLEETIFSLEETPFIGTPTHENPIIRQFIYGKKPHFYRILYKVNEDKGTVSVLRILHGRRDRGVRPS